MGPPLTPQAVYVDNYQRVPLDIEASPIEENGGICYVGYCTRIFNGICYVFYHPQESIVIFLSNHRQCISEWLKVMIIILPFLLFIYGNYIYNKGVSHNGYYKNHGMFEPAKCESAQRYCDMRVIGFLLQLISVPIIFCIMILFCHFVCSD